MPTALVLTGNCGVGKTTVARAWADARGGAAVHADDMHLWIRVRDRRRLHNYQERWKAAVAIAAAQGLLEQGLDVAVENVWFPASCALLRDALTAHAAVHVVRLVCERAENRDRDARRPANARMGPRVDVLGDEVDAQAWPEFLRVVDTSGQSVAATMAAIDACIAAGERA
jgi:predicted kinase